MTPTPALAFRPAMLSAGQAFGRPLPPFDIALAERADTIARPNIVAVDVAESGIQSTHAVQPAAAQTDPLVVNNLSTPQAALTDATAWLSSMPATPEAAASALDEVQPGPVAPSLAAPALSSHRLTSPRARGDAKATGDTRLPANVTGMAETQTGLSAELPCAGTTGPANSPAPDALMTSDEEGAKDAGVNEAQAEGPYIAMLPVPSDAKPGIMARNVHGDTRPDTTRLPGILKEAGLETRANLVRRGQGTPVRAEPALDAPDRSLPTAVPEQMGILSSSDTIFALPDMSAALSDVRNSAVGLQALTSAQAVADRQLNLARDSLWLDQLATDILAASDSADHISFRLMPAQLGRLDVDLTTSTSGLTVNIATSTEEAGRIVSSAQAGLVESLQSQGVRVADTQVTTGNDMSRHGQSSRHHPTTPLNEPIMRSADESIEQHEDRPDGRFA